MSVWYLIIKHILMQLLQVVVAVLNIVWNIYLQGKVYVYDKVFKPNATQEAVYNTAAKPIVGGKS